MLSGRAAWDDIGAALDAHGDELGAFAAAQSIQTNEVQRAWAILPGLLALGAARIRLLEIGASAGLLLALDEYDFRYRAGSWGRGEDRLVLGGDDRGGPPAELLARPLRVTGRAGVDLEPVALDGAGAKLLEAFVWADQAERIERLRTAVEIAREREISIERGDYVERLPELLARRSTDALTVVLSSVTTTYLAEDRYRELRQVLARAGRDGPLAWLALDGPRGQDDYGGLALELTTWPPERTRRLARVDFHAGWLEWL